MGLFYFSWFSALIVHLALLFRDPVVSMSKLGGSFSRGWQVSTFFSLCLDIFDQVSQGHSVGSCKVGDVIKQYNTLMCKVQELDIEQLATQKCLINVGILVAAMCAAHMLIDLTAHRERISPIYCKRTDTKLVRVLRSFYRDVLFGSSTI